ncbi:MAG: crotonase/enoyl-CoA hydratase family protein [Gammaproteobacteria bacterium]|nr:crotonase/enoyl-CoA hydratase family protein [Gammaproteobacteria bacterium]
MNVNLDITDDLALIALDDGKKNAITTEAVQAINEAMDEADKEAKAFVLAGRPGSFCAGFDMATMMGDDPEAALKLALGGTKLVLRLYEEPKPVVAACTGHAFTIGAFWLLACDTRIGEAGNFKLGFNETAMGMKLGPWCLAIMQSRINTSYQAQTITQARLHNPEHAVRAGILDELTAEGGSIEAALTAAATLAAYPAEAYAHNKLALRSEVLEVMRNDIYRAH